MSNFNMMLLVRRMGGGEGVQSIQYMYYAVEQLSDVF
jgi:hypothetical protein